MVRGGVAASLAIWLGAGVAQAQAAPQRIKLRYSAPAECPDDLELVQAVEEFLGQSLRDAREQDLAIDVRAQGDAKSGYSAKVSFVGAQGTQERYADHPECSKLTEAAALMIAIAIDPERMKARQRGEAKTDAAPAVTPVNATTPVAPISAEPAALQIAPTPVSPDRDASSVAPSERSDGPPATLALLALTGSGSLPSVAPGVGADFAVRLGPLEVGVGGRYWISRDATVPTAPASSIEVSLITGGLRLCGVPTFGHWSLPLCLRGDLGDMEGTGQDIPNARTRHALFAALGGGLALSYTRHRLVPVAGLDLHWAPARPRFGALRDREEVVAFRPDAWGLSGFVGLAYQL
jgi:hypothetical protein